MIASDSYDHAFGVVFEGLKHSIVESSQGTAELGQVLDLVFDGLQLLFFLGEFNIPQINDFNLIFLF